MDDDGRLLDEETRSIDNAQKRIMLSGRMLRSGNACKRDRICTVKRD